MNQPRREVIIAPVALQQMVGASPIDEEREAIRNVLTDLAGDPHLGYKIPFLKPQAYRIDVGRFRIHYRFDERHVWTEFIGVY